MSADETGEWLSIFRELVSLLARDSGIRLPDAVGGDNPYVATVEMLTALEAEIAQRELAAKRIVRGCDVDPAVKASRALTVDLERALDGWCDCLVGRLERLAEGSESDSSLHGLGLEKERKSLQAEFDDAARLTFGALQSRYEAFVGSRATDEERDPEAAYREMRLRLLLQLRAEEELAMTVGRFGPPEERRRRLRKLLERLNRAQMIARLRGLQREKDKKKSDRSPPELEI
jgi:hypothetical protein